MLRIRNNLIDGNTVGAVIFSQIGTEDYDFYDHQGNIMFTLDLEDAEFEVVAAYLGEEVFDDAAPTGVFSHEAVADDTPTGVFSRQAAA